MASPVTAVVGLSTVEVSPHHIDAAANIVSTGMDPDAELTTKC